MPGSLQVQKHRTITADGTAGLTTTAAKPVTVAGTGDQQKVKVMSSARIPTISFLSMTGLVSKHVPGWRRKKHGKARFADGRMMLTLNARARATVVDTGVERQEALKRWRASPSQEK